MKICSCGFTEFQIETDDNVLVGLKYKVKICCVKCGTVYFPNEIEDLPDTED